MGRRGVRRRQAIWAGAAMLAATAFGGGEADASSRALCTRANVDAYVAEFGDRLVVDKKAFYQALQERHGRTFRKYAKPGRHFIGTDAILDEWNDSYALEDTRMLAYILATAWHETGTKMFPIREAFAETDEQAIARLNKHFRNRTRNIYWRPVPPTNRAYFGRGYVQLTWADNYKKADTWLGIDKEAEDFKQQSFFWNPDRVLEERASIQITYSGMFYGWYVPGHCLLRHFRPNVKAGWASARRIINGVDKKEKIAREATQFHEVLLMTGVAVPPADLEERQKRRAAEEEAEQAAKKAEEERQKEAELDQLSRIQRVTDRLRASEARIIELERRLAEAVEAQKKRTADVEAEFVSLRDENEDLSAEVNALVDRSTAQRAEIELVRSQLGAESGRVNALREENAALRRDMAALRASTEAALAAANRSIATIQSQIVDLGAQVKLANERTLWDFIFGRSGSDETGG